MNNSLSSPPSTTPIKLELDLHKGSLIVNRKQRDETSAKTRAILQRKTTVGITDEQIIRIRKTMSRLIELAPVTLTPEMKVAKAFMIWADKLPLIQKCDELAAQLRERSYALTTIKECYLRDIVSIRIHLENYYKENKMDDNIKELNSIPSVDLRSLIQTTHDEQQQTGKSSSYSLKDSLLKANLISSEISENWIKNPWDQSHAYALYRERKDQMKLSMPKGGNSINLYAPSRHRLYIKYCKQCIGIMTFITDWNNDIEKMIKQRIEGKTNDELRQIIRNLNDYLIDKSEECEKLKTELDTIRSGGKYLNFWNETEKNLYEKTDLESKIKKFRELSHEWHETALMSQEDHQIILQKYLEMKNNLNFNENKYQEEIGELRRQYETKIQSKDEAIKSMKEALYERDLVIEQKDMTLEKQMMKLNEQMKETERYIRVNQQLLISIDEKDRILTDYRQEAMTMIESLELQVTKLNEDISSLEKQNENLIKIQEEKEEEARLKLEQEKRLKTQSPMMRPGGQLYEEMSEDQPSQSNPLAHFMKMKAVIGVLPRHLRKVLAHNITKYAPVITVTESDDLDAVSGSLMEENEEEEVTQVEGIQEENKEEKTSGVGIENDEGDEILSIESFGSKHSDGGDVVGDEIQEKFSSKPPSRSSSRKTMVEKKSSNGGRLTSAVVSSPKNIPQKRLTEVKKSTSRTTIVSDVVRASQKFQQGSVSKRSTMISRSSSSFRSPSLLPTTSSGMIVTEKDLTDKSVLADVLAGEDEEPKGSTGFSSMVRTKLVTRQTLRTRLSIAKKLSSFEMPISPSNQIITTVGQIQEEVLSPSSSSSSPEYKQQYQAYNQQLLRTQSSTPGAGGAGSGGGVASGISGIGDGSIGEDIHDDGLQQQQPSLPNLSSSYHEGVSNLLELLVPYIKPPTSLKIVALAIRFTIRFYNGIQRKDYNLLGSWGLKQLVHLHQHKYETIRMEMEQYQEENHKYEKKIEKLNDTIKNLLNKIHILEKEKLKLNEKIVDYEDDHQRDHMIRRRYKIIAQNERSIAFELMKYINYIRKRIYILGNSKDIPLIKAEISLNIEGVDQGTSNPTATTSSTTSGTTTLTTTIPTTSTTNTSSSSSTSFQTKSQRLFHLKEKLIRSIKNMIEVFREHKLQSPLKIFQLNSNYSLNFPSYGSKYRNELRDMKHYFRYLLYDMNQLENKFYQKQENINKLILTINDMIIKLQCPTCIEYKNLYLKQQHQYHGSHHPLAATSSDMVSLLEFNWDNEEYLSNPTIQRLKTKLYNEILSDINKKYENNYQEYLEKYREKEEKFYEEIQNLKINQKNLENNEIKLNNLIHELNNKNNEMNERINQLIKNNTVLRIAIQDSYRCVQYEQEQEEYYQIHKKNNLKDFSAQFNYDSDILNKNNEEEGEEDQEDVLHQLDPNLKLQAKKFLKRYTGINQSPAISSTATTTMTRSTTITHTPNSILPRPTTAPHPHSMLHRPSTNPTPTFQPSSSSSSPTLSLSTNQNRTTSPAIPSAISNNSIRKTSVQRQSNAGKMNSMTGSIDKKTSKFETIRNIPNTSSQVILPPSKLIDMEISEEDTQDMEHQQSKDSDDCSRVDDIIYKPAYHMDLRKTSQMAAHLQKKVGWGL